jgi:hypothetical protein
MQKLRTLGLTLVAAFAISGAIASSASADELTAELYPITLTSNSNSLEFTFTSGGADCVNSKYVGTVTGATTTISLSAEHSGCLAFGFPAAIDMNGCTLLFHIAGESSTSFGSLDFVCSEKKEVTITASSAGTLKCTVHVPPQHLSGIVKYSNVGTGSTREIVINVNVGGISYTHTKGSGLGACTGGSSTTGSLFAEIPLTAEIDGGTAHLGAFLS